MAAIQELKDWRARDALRLLIYTGCRKSEILSLKWANVKLDSKMLILEETKNDRINYVPLVDEAIGILKDIERTSSPFVFPASSASGHIVDIARPWARVKKSTGISDLRIHDLRRTLGSWLAQDNVSSDIIGDVLNHKSKASTAVYARMCSASKRHALERYAYLLKSKNIS
jgi:integrase